MTVVLRLYWTAPRKRPSPGKPTTPRDLQAPTVYKGVAMAVIMKPLSICRSAPWSQDVHLDREPGPDPSEDRQTAQYREGNNPEDNAAEPAREGKTMSVKNWEEKVLDEPGAAQRVAEIEDELRLAAGLTALREQAGLSQRELAKRIGVSQPRVAAIEQSRNVTIDVLEQYVEAVGGQLEVSVVKGNRKTPLIRARARQAARTSSGRSETLPRASKKSA